MQRTSPPEPPRERQPRPPRAARRAPPWVVAIVSSVAKMAGAEYTALHLARRLDPGRWKAVLICSEQGDLTTEFQRAGLDVHLLPRPTLLSTSIRLNEKYRLPNPFACAWDVGALWVASQRLAPLLDRLQPDLIMTEGLFTHFYGGLAARRCGVPCVWHTQDFISERWFGLFRRCMGLVGQRLPTAIIANGEPTAAQFPPDVQAKVRVIHNAADTAMFRPGGDRGAVRAELGLPDSALVVGQVARLTPWKGQMYLLEAFARLANDFPEARLLIAGSPVFDSDAYERSLKARTAELALSDRVVFAGYRRDIPRVLSALDVLASPAIEKDIVPLAVLEAMSSGLPVVAFDIPGVRLIIDRPECGVLCPVEQLDPLTQSLRDLFRDADLRRRMGAAARRRVEEAFSLDRQVGKFEQAFLELLEEASAGAPTMGPDGMIRDTHPIRP